MELDNAYLEMLGKVPDAKIAELAGVDVDVVTKARETLGVEGAAPAPAKPEKATAEKAKAAKPEKATAEPVPVEAAPAVDDTPTCVRVVGRHVRVPHPDGTGRIMNLAFRDIYSGEMAAWLWLNHRKHVEIFPRG